MADKRMDGKSMSITADNLEKMKQILPEAFIEGRIDFDILQELLGEELDEGKERYSFTWKGKMEAIRLVQKQSTGTLRPSIKDSVGKDGISGKFDSDNLYIEGDNLEVLKLLQASYHNSIKMIYIDPPYNTGKDFIYKDNFADNISNYKEVTEQDTKSNAETDGRYHTNWLNMMYPRLKCARILLKDDGVISISIDDNEVHNLRKICDEIFGEDNFVGDFVRKTKSMTNDAKSGFNLQHENCLIYAKNLDRLLLTGGEKDLSGYSNPDNDPNGDWAGGDPSAKSGGAGTYFEIKILIQEK